MTKKERMELKKQKLLELSGFDSQYQIVVGIDEAGRGPLAGPVVAAACIIEYDEELVGIDDSKKVSEKERERLFDVIVEKAIKFGIGIVDNHVIDEINILNATKEAMKMALSQIDCEYDNVITDCVKLEVSKPLYDIVKADAKSLSTACASILAKVTRDRMMLQYAKEYPHYGFEKNKGYGTALHYQGIEQNGICEIHRRSFLKGIEYKNH